MKFRFCGNSDCPDWVLAVIITLSKLSSVKLKLLTQIVVEGILNPPLKMESALKLFSESKLDFNLDLKACISCLNFIVTSTTRFACETAALHCELQQLGLPREHSVAIKKVLDDKQENISKKLEAATLRVNQLESVSADVHEESGCAILNFKINGQENQVTLTDNTLNILLQNLKELSPKMEELRTHNFN